MTCESEPTSFPSHHLSDNMSRCGVGSTGCGEGSWLGRTCWAHTDASMDSTPQPYGSSPWSLLHPALLSPGMGVNLFQNNIDTIKKLLVGFFPHLVLVSLLFFLKRSIHGQSSFCSRRADEPSGWPQSTNTPRGTLTGRCSESQVENHLQVLPPTSGLPPGGRDPFLPPDFNPASSARIALSWGSRYQSVERWGKKPQACFTAMTHLLTHGRAAGEHTW